MKEKISLKDYVDRIVADLKIYVDTNFTSDRKAVDQYSKTNDEWKFLHNGLQRKMEEDRNMFVTREMMDRQKEMLDKQIQVLWSRVVSIVIILAFLLSVYQYFKK